MSKHFAMLKGKTIRDSVHGDIFLSDKFLAIIDTPEFQRLRRIHQLSVAYLVFPGAEHTRFAHSIGTYYIMQKIIEHFKPIMNSVNIELSEREINLALAVALLHDIGHGPFSHAFEKAIPNSDDHEKWTIRIITCAESNINRVLKDSFDDNFPNDLADIIRKEKSVKKNGLSNKDFEQIDLFFILSSLISSQLDADRMDYLLRDSMYTGVIFGSIDIERIISSMTITVHDNNYYVCVMEKFLSDIENYLLARYQMHKEVYLHDVKCEMEIIIKKILERAFKIYKDSKTVGALLPLPLLKLFEGKSMTVKEYVSLDDHILLSLFSHWMQSEDSILRNLCSCIINRKKYNKVYILYNTEQDISEFKKELKDILRKYGYHIDDYKKEYFFLESIEAYKIYKKNKDNIWILKNDGTLNDICDISKVVNEGLNGEKNMIFINYEIFKESEKLKNAQQVIKDIKDLVKIYNNRNHIEIEKKYVFGDISIFDKVLKLLQAWGEYEISTSEGFKVQKDYYYDTEERCLFRENKTLRFRMKDDDCQLTIKTPTKASHKSKGIINNDIQSERFEYEVSVTNESKNDNRQYIIKYLPELSDETNWNSLQRSLTIINNREKINLHRNNVCFELVFDNVKYVNINGKESLDYQIEIELKSDYLHRINLKMLSDYLERNVPELKPMNESKYKRGLMLTE